jgi:hypothetical protein
MSAKEKKNTTTPEKYPERLKTKGSFIDIIKAAGNNAKRKKKKKQ